MVVFDRPSGRPLVLIMTAAMGCASGFPTLGGFGIWKGTGSLFRSYGSQYRVGRMPDREKAFENHVLMLVDEIIIWISRGRSLHCSPNHRR